MSTSDKQLLDIIFSYYLKPLQLVLNPSLNFPENVHENDLVYLKQKHAEQSLTLGIPEALLDPLLYFSLLGSGAGEGLLYLNSRSMTSFDPPRRSFYTIAAQ